MANTSKPSPLYGLEQGALNPVLFDKINKRIDLKTTTTTTLLKQLTEFLYDDKALEGITEFNGQVLRVIEDVQNFSDNFYLYRMIKSITADANVKIYKVRIPEIFAHLPIPDTFDQTEKDKVIIDLYPDFIYVPSDGADKPINVGDIVVTKFGNLKTFSDPKIISKIGNSPAGQGSLKPLGAKNSQDIKQAFKESIKTSLSQLDKTKNIHTQFDTDKITLQDFKTFFNNSSKADTYYSIFLKLFKKYGANTPARVAAILGQISVESGNLNFTKELPSIYNKKDPKDPNEATGTLYEGKVSLGNNQVGDGPKFIGRGLIQLTGRANYTVASGELKVDILQNPQLLETSQQLIAETAFFFFKKNNIFSLADSEDFYEITKKVNGPGMFEKEKRLEYTINNIKILQKYV